MVIALVAIHHAARTNLGRTAEGFDGARAFKGLEQFVVLGPRPPGSEPLSAPGSTLAHSLRALGLKYSVIGSSRARQLAPSGWSILWAFCAVQARMS